MVIIFAPEVQAGQLKFLAGAESVALNKGEDGYTNYLLYAVGAEYSSGGKLWYGFNASYSAKNNDTDLGVKGDGYLKYNFFPKYTLNPYLSVGFSAAAFKYQECGIMNIGNGNAGTYAHNGCVSHSVSSFGAIYQVGTIVQIGKRFEADAFWSQFIGTNNVILNMIGFKVRF
jgi:hypothetical protein